MELTNIEAEVNEIVKVAKGMVVIDNESETFAVEFLKVIARGKKQVGEEFDENVEEAYALHKRLTAQRKKFLDPLKEADEAVRNTVKGYRLDLEKKRLEDEHKAKEALEASVRKDQDELLAKAQEAVEKGDTQTANSLAQQAFRIEAGGVHVASSAVKQDGMSSKVIWKARVVDQTILPPEFLICTPNQKAIDSWVKEHGNEKPIRGVEYYQDVDMRIRA